MPVMGRESAVGGGVAVRLLGPVEIGPAGGVMTSVAQPRLRVVLGLLGVVAGRMVTADALVDGVWGRNGRRAGRRTCTPWCTSCGDGWPR
jgi:hypothetical protein